MSQSVMHAVDKLESI